MCSRSHWTNKGYTLGDLANILTLISSVDEETALAFLAEMHYFFLVRERHL